MSPIHEPNFEQAFTTPEAHSVSIEDTPESIRESIHRIMDSYTPPEGKLSREDLAEEPYLARTDLENLLNAPTTPEGLQEIPTELIVGSESPSFENWADEYSTRPGQVEKTAENLRAKNQADWEQIFGVMRKEGRMNFKKIRGPVGDFFMAKDGTHRAASAKLAQVPKIIGEVEQQEIPAEIDTDNLGVEANWEEMIKLGLIEGNIEAQPDAKIKKLKIKSAKVPWVFDRWPNFVKTNKAYEKLYPNGLESLNIPKEVLDDESGIAKNYFLADRWEEYKEKFLGTDLTKE